MQKWPAEEHQIHIQFTQLGEEMVKFVGCFVVLATTDRSISIQICQDFDKVSQVDDDRWVGGMGTSRN